jgi:hypothetical protein
MGYQATLNAAGQLSDQNLQAYLTRESSTEFGAANINTVLTQINKDKNVTGFTPLYETLSRVDKTVGSGMFLTERSADVTNLASDINELTGSQLESIHYNKDSTLRQYEINEWENSNKLDTLYFLQVLFICVSFIGAILFLKMNGFISQMLYTMLSGITVTILLLILLFRARYTYSMRDSKYWSKARFPSSPKSA